MMKANEYETFFMVMSDRPESYPPRVRHPTLDIARNEAKRLANTNPGTKFYVLASLGHMLRDDPVSWHAHDEIPF